MKNFKNIFSFTFFSSVKGRGYIALTVIMALLFFLLPATVMTAVEYFGGEETVPEYTYNVTEVFVADTLEGIPASIAPLAVGTPFESVKFTSLKTPEEARTLAASVPTSLILVLETDEYGRIFNIVIPEGSTLTDGDTAAFADFISENSVAIMLIKSELTPEQLSELIKTTVTVTPEGDNGTGIILELVGAFAPMLYALMLYFMLIFYSQGVATSVISEKHSKLMDTLLISTTPAELIFGKTLAVAFAGISQLTVWLLSLVGGFGVGTALVKSINPDSDMAIFAVFDILSEVGDLFSPIGVIITLLFVIFGFLLYCSLSAIGGAISEKPEDLSSNNIIYTGVMMVSFLVVIFTNPIYTGKSISKALLYIPFTSILTVPTQLLMGNISAWEALVSLLIVIAVTAGIGVLAGRLYKTFALYKGKFPGIKKAISILLSERKS